MYYLYVIYIYLCLCVVLFLACYVCKSVCCVEWYVVWVDRVFLYDKLILSRKLQCYHIFVTEYKIKVILINLDFYLSSIKKPDNWRACQDWGFRKVKVADILYRFANLISLGFEFWTPILLIICENQWYIFGKCWNCQTENCHWKVHSLYN